MIRIVLIIKRPDEVGYLLTIVVFTKVLDFVTGHVEKNEI